ncbi:hypothetical protein [Cellulomonas massiliensis]|uniref:hypothetical protein n=1 Tax=Cellulomonas massiliensis TaxID=1465811 RepID=UPI00031C3F7F|nr:hypothetical protein [Cellulomonas massiliensis]
MDVGGIGRALVALLLGLVVGAAGTVAHRAVPPWGLVLGGALVLASVVTLRAWGGLRVVVPFVVGTFGAAFLLAGEGPGGDVLVPEGDGAWWVWIAAAAVATLVGCLLPRRWFRDEVGEPHDERPQALAAVDEGPGAA